MGAVSEESDTGGKSFEPLRCSLLPARGLMFAANAAGRAVPPEDLERWMRLNRAAFKMLMIDVLAGSPDVHRLTALLAAAAQMDVRLSLRANAEMPPPNLSELARAGLLDVFVTGPGDPEAFRPWLDRAQSAGLPLRLQVCPPFSSGWDAAAFAGECSEAGVTAVHAALRDPFAPCARVRTQEPSAKTLGHMQEVIGAFSSKEIEANLLWAPFCAIPRELWPHLRNAKQFFCDHQQYGRLSYDWAVRMRTLHPVWIGMIVRILLARHLSFPNPIDERLLPWIVERPWFMARFAAWHKLTSPMRWLRSVPRPFPEDAIPDTAGPRPRRHNRPECQQCSMRLICDGFTEETGKLLADLVPKPVSGELVIDPMAFALSQRRHLNTVDRDRLRRMAADDGLVHEARHIVDDLPPDRQVSTFEYASSRHPCYRTAGVVRWYSYAPTERLSTPLARLTLPFTIAAAFGGGFAEHIGFAVGSDCRLLCPMTAPSHRLVLHVAGDGRYVMLRDGEPVSPVEFAGLQYVPSRLPGVAEPCLCLWNIDGAIGTNAVSIWHESREPVAACPQARCSAVIVCSGYAHRLQACLQSLAHQAGLPAEAIEAVVAYVQGTDATDDVIGTIGAAHPGLRVIRKPVAREYALNKGLLINEAVRLASGEWVVILDADTLLAPRMLAALASLPDSACFAAPDGRKMLSRETTARILLGEIAPWECWEVLLAGPGEFRLREAGGAPIGFCQCVRRRCFEQVAYQEYPSFEGADWQFGQDLRARFGPEHRLDGLPVLHLDHGGSNWYGTNRQR